MVTLAVLCSGQGAQARGMFDLVAEAPEAAPVFAAAKTVLGGRDPRDAAASQEDLHGNGLAQVLCCAQALAVWSVLRPRVQARVVVAGYSVGEVAAWGVAEAMEPATVFEVVAKRAALMDADAAGPAGLLAIRGLPLARVEALCREAGVHVAIRNGPDRFVVGGSRAALDRAAAGAQSMSAAGVTAIAVEVPSHTPLLQRAAAAFGDVLASRTDIGKPDSRLISGIDGATVFDVGEGLAKLGRQVAQTVRWDDCLDACCSAGATRSLELGPGNALAHMMAGALGERDSRSVADFASIDGVVRWLERP